MVADKRGRMGYIRISSCRTMCCGGLRRQRSSARRVPARQIQVSQLLGKCMQRGFDARIGESANLLLHHSAIVIEGDADMRDRPMTKVRPH